MRNVVPADPLRQEDLEGLAKQLGARVAKHPLGSGVDQQMRPVASMRMMPSEADSSTARAVS